MSEKHITVVLTQYLSLSLQQRHRFFPMHVSAMSTGVARHHPSHPFAGVWTVSMGHACTVQRHKHLSERRILQRYPHEGVPKEGQGAAGTGQSWDGGQGPQ